MFNQKILQFDLQECKKFMIILVVENGWCLYEIDLDSKTLYVMDPMMASSTQDKMEWKHMKTSCLMWHCFSKCLHEWYPDWHFATYPWTYKYNSGMHKDYSSADSGFYVLHYIKEFDGVILKTTPTPKETAYQVLALKGNKADFRNSMYGRILE